jgi:phosphonate transport system substrate-binding protein
MCLLKSGRALCQIALGISVLVVAGWLAGCRRAEPPLDVRLSDLVAPTAEATSRPPDQRTLRMAVAVVNSPRITLAHYARLVDYLADHLGMQGELVQGKTYAEINDLVREGNVTLAMVCTNPYLEGQEDFGMQALAVPEVNGEAVYYSYLIVPQDSPASRLEDLRDKTFAFTDPLSNSGRLVIVYQLALMGETSESFFSRYIFTYSHEHAIKAVADGLVDGAAVDSLIYDYFAAVQPERVAGTKVIARYGPFGSNPIVVHPRLDPTLKTRLQELLLAMHQDPQGREILAALRIDRFVLPNDAAYDPVREMRRRVRGTSQPDSEQ